MSLKISELSAEDRARLMRRDGGLFRWLDGHTIAAWSSVRGKWQIESVNDHGGVDGSHDGYDGYDLILPPRKIERRVWLHVWPAGANVGSAAYGRPDIAPATTVLAKICIDLSEVFEGEGLDGNVPEFRLTRVK
jgi:hypothetical protein